MKTERIYRSTERLKKDMREVHEQYFEEKLKSLDNMLKKYDIEREDVVIVNGAALEALGIRKSGDLDIIISTKGRERLEIGKDGKRLNDLIEVLPADQYKTLDDKIIFDDRFYVFINGYKIIRPTFMLKNRTFKSFFKKKVRRDTWLMIKFLLS